MQLIVSRKGAALRVANDCLLVQTDDGKQRFAPQSLSSVVLEPGCSLSSDVLLWAVDHRIDVLLQDGLGQPQGRVGSHRYGSISTIRKQQVLFARSQAATGWVVDILAEKAENCGALLFSFVPSQPQQERAILESVAQLNEYVQKMQPLRQQPLETAAPSLRGLEGSASRVYFKTLARLLPNDYYFARRSHRPATDRFNSMLNYAYGMLYRWLESALVRKGVDPYLGVFHADGHQRPVLVYDLIEKYRIWADYVVTDLCGQQVLTTDHFDQSNPPVCWLSEEARRWLAQQMHDYMGGTLPDSNLSRQQQLNHDCQQLANYLKAGSF